MSIEQTFASPTKVHIQRGVWAVLLFMVAFFAITTRPASAEDTTLKGDQRLVTVYDQGQEKTFVTTKTTIGDALRAEGVHLEGSDRVEPRESTKMVASNYRINVYRARSVVVQDGANKIQVQTAEQSPKRVMEAAGLAMHDEDKAAFELSRSPIADGGAGLRLVVDRATSFTFDLYGKSFEARSQAETVGDMLREKGVKLGTQDGKSATDDTPLVAGMLVRIWRDGKQTITQEEDVAMPTRQVHDADRSIGFKEVRTPGKVGKRQVTYEITTVGGQVTERREIQSVVTQQPVEQVEVIGVRSTTPTENEAITWGYLIGQGFSRNQTAGIMGNLQQEHGFRTDGDGLAQWTLGRKDALMARPDPYSIYTQLDFLMFELNGKYLSVKTNILASSSVEQSVIIFQNQFERCGYCMQDRRIQFAHEILARH